MCDTRAPRATARALVSGADGCSALSGWGCFPLICHLYLSRVSDLFDSVSVSWASKDAVWNNMLEKDKSYTRDVHMMDKHPHLQPKMRAILLDWLMEVSTESVNLQHHLISGVSIREILALR